MVDNFDIIAPLLRFENPGDCYYVQLLRRQSDDPMIGGKPDPSYHGNMHSRSIKDYLVQSVDYLEKIKPDIIKLCQDFNVRAYIRLNKRNYKNIALEMMKHIAEQCASGESFSSPFHLVASACGQVCQAGEDKTWILDLDEEYIPHKTEIYKMLLKCEPIASKWNEFQETQADMFRDRFFGTFISMNFIEIPTKHGLHIISRPFNKASINTYWTEYCIENKITAPVPQTHSRDDGFDFSLTGIYLNRKNDFLDCCNKLTESEMQVIDKNKVIVHTGTLDIGRLDSNWHEYGIRENFWMPLFDIHKDNPTCLFVP